jgi:hypothetical protein
MLAGMGVPVRTLGLLRAQWIQTLGGSELVITWVLLGASETRTGLPTLRDCWGYRDCLWGLCTINQGLGQC